MNQIQKERFKEGVDYYYGVDVKKKWNERQF